MEPVHPFLIISFFNLLSACSEINSHFNQKEISQNRILHHARKPLDGDDCLVVFINRISMLHQNSYGFLDSIHVFYIRNFAIFIFYRTQAQNEPDCSARNISDGWMLPGDASYKDGNRALFLSAPGAFRFQPIRGLSGLPLLLPS